MWYSEDTEFQMLIDVFTHHRLQAISTRGQTQCQIVVSTETQCCVGLETVDLNAFPVQWGVPDPPSCTVRLTLCTGSSLRTQWRLVGRLGPTFTVVSSGA